MMHSEAQKITNDILENLGANLNLNTTAFEEVQTEYVSGIVKKLTFHLDDSLKNRILNEFLDAGPINELLLKPDLSEILINSPNEVWFEQNGKLQRHKDAFLSEVTYHSFFNRLQLESQVEATSNVPFIDGVWRGHRFHMVINPVSVQNQLSIRIKSQQNWSLESLSAMEWCSSDQRDCLKQLVENRKSFLVVGGTSSGKTTVLNSLIQLLEKTERAVIVEDTRELFLPNKVSTSLCTRFDTKGLLKDITLQDLVKQTLRMRPDRIIMGEVRGPEAKDLLMAFATGHEGSFGTLHASNEQEALLRLEMLIQLGAPQWSIGAIRRLIGLALSHIVVVNKDKSGKRKLYGIYRISSVEDFGILTEKIA